MQSLQILNISSSPGYPEVVRKIIVAGRNEDYINKTVTLICQIEHFDKEDNRLKAFSAIEKEPFLLIASDASFVNPQTGKLVFQDENGHYPEGSVGQYTWLRQAVINGANPFLIAEHAILEADRLNRFT